MTAPICRLDDLRVPPPPPVSYIDQDGDVQMYDASLDKPIFNVARGTNRGIVCQAVKSMLLWSTAYMIYSSRLLTRSHLYYGGVHYVALDVP